MDLRLLHIAVLILVAALATMSPGVIVPYLSTDLEETRPAPRRGHTPWHGSLRG